VDGMAAFIQKPYELNQLADVVESVLRGETSRMGERVETMGMPGL
jgi:FixJ family two-component response regulator